ncbi:MAG: PaaI family thioesterase [Syntrophotaleaceae bacterium]
MQAVFSCDPENLRSRCTLTLGENFQGWRGVVHGGVIASLLDEACIYAGRSLGETLVTAELTVRYRKPVPVGQAVTVSGEVLERRRKVLKVKARLEIDSELYAEADGRVFLID